MVVCLIISLLVFFIALDLNYAIYFRIMLLLMMIAMFYRTISRLEAMVKKGIEAHTYHQMAYIDALTNLYNRTAFEERMKSLQKERECYTLTFVIFDINRLKHVNDTYGHSAGDQLIKCAADCISEKFAHIGTCYRIGGDEFVVILMDFSEKSLEKIMEEFQEYVAQANPGNPEGLSVAADYATGPASGDNFAYILFNEADKRMYIQKEKTSGKLK